MACFTLWAMGTVPSLTFGQSEASIAGTVVTRDGEPISGAKIFFGRDGTSTNEKGEFRLAHPSAVMHFVKDDLRPLTLVVRPQASQLTVVMSPADNNFIVPACAQLKSAGGQKQIGGRLRFLVPGRGVKTSGGKPDIDYVDYGLRPRSGKSYLRFSFGPFAWSPEPEDKLFIDSIDFEQRSLVDQSGRVVGQDTRGRLRTGGEWRQATVWGDGEATYQNAPPGDANLFDQIINSICQAAPIEAR